MSLREISMKLINQVSAYILGMKEKNILQEIRKSDSLQTGS